MAESSKNINLSCVEPNSNARVEGRVTAISPMKAGKSCNYYEEELSDDHTSLRFCGFSATTHRKFEGCYDNSKLVLPEGCKIKKLDKGMAWQF